MPPSEHGYDYEYIKEFAPNYSMEDHNKKLEERENQVLRTSYLWLLHLHPMYFEKLIEIKDEELNKEDFDRREYLSSYDFEEMHWVPDMIDYIEKNYNKFKYENVTSPYGFVTDNHNIRLIEQATQRDCFLQIKNSQ